ncbi:DNA primase [Methylobacterium sp. WL122]|nr:DNA primase [Methylobacterium sp. WL122]
MNALSPIDFIKRGFSVTPLWPMQKKPQLGAWESTTVTLEDLNDIGSFPDDYNLGIVLGTASDGIVDVDLDCKLAVEAGKALLPSTQCVFGRNDNPFSHYLYRCSGSKRTKQFKHPITNAALIELRANGSQTVLPGSIYNDGQTIRFEDDRDGDAGVVAWDELYRTCRLIAVVCLLCEYWIKGRHSTALAFAGMCAGNKINLQQARTVVATVCAVMNDEETDDRLKCVTTSYDRVAGSRLVQGRGELTNIIGDVRVVNKMIEWMSDNIIAASVAQGHQSISKYAFQKYSDMSSDMSSGAIFCSHIGDRLVYRDDEDRFYSRLNDVYDPGSVPVVKSLVMDFIAGQQDDIRNESDAKKVKSSQSVSRINAIVDVARSKLNRLTHEFDADPFLVGCQNGVLDLRTHALVEPKCIITRRIGTTYNPHSTCPKFHDFLQQVFEGNKAKVAFIRRAIGYTLTGSSAGQCLFVTVGTGANGKSTFLKVIQALMGEYGGTIPSHSLMVSKFGNDKTDDLASLVGKRFVSASEGELGQKLAIAKVKQMTGGDTISVRPLYGKYFNMSPEFKIWFGTNDLPVICGGDEAIWRRIHVIDFPASFKENQRDGRLFEKLKLELPGVLNWALQGLRELGNLEGDFLAPPDCVRMETGRYRSSSDTVSSFIEAACRSDENATTMSNLLYERYTGWCNFSSIDPVSNVQFGKELTRLGYEVKRMKMGNARKGLKFA